MRQKFKVPLYGNLNRSAIIPIGAAIGTDLLLPDGSVATLQTLAAALQRYLTSTSTSNSGGIGGLSVTLWSLIQGIPLNVQAVAALASSGLVVRKADGSWTTRTLEGAAGRIVVANGSGDAGNPAVDLASFTGLSVLGVTGSTTAKPAAIIGTAGQLLRVKPSSSAPPDVDYLGKTLNAGSSNSSTFNAVNIGTASASRRVVISVIGEQNGSTVFTPTLTIGGNAASLDVFKQGPIDGSGNRATIAVFSLTVPAGTSANVVYTFPGITLFDCTIYVYAITILDAAADTATNQTSVGGAPALLPVNVDTLPGSVVITAAAAWQTGDTWDWTGVTQDDSQVLYGGLPQSVAHAVATIAETRSVVAMVDLFSGTNTGAAVAVSYPSLAPGDTVEFQDITLEMLADVIYLTGTPADGQVLTYDAYLNAWVPVTPTGGGGGGGGFPPQLGYAGGI